MGNCKITMRDIAKDCGISVATVSYVLNHSEKEKISHETRLKVMESATRLHYEPRAVRAASKTRSGLIGVIINLKETNTAGKKILYYDLAAELSNQLRTMGYETILITTKNLSQDMGIVKKHSLDAVFMIDTDNRTVRKITEGYYAPILFIDCIVNDPLFCEIRPDYTALFTQAKSLLETEQPFLLMEDFCCQYQMEQFSQYFLTKDIFINSAGSNLSSFLQGHANRKGIVLGDVLGMQAQALFPCKDLCICAALGNPGLFSPSSPVLHIPNRTKAAVAAEVLQDMLSLDYQASSTNCVLLESEQL
jgi:DNA-binding Lrp family transcriptional regulator